MLALKWIERRMLQLIIKNPADWSDADWEDFQYIRTSSNISDWESYLKNIPWFDENQTSGINIENLFK